VIRYGFNHWQGLVRFLDDGRIEMDTNSVEARDAAYSSQSQEIASSPATIMARSTGPALLR